MYMIDNLKILKYVEFVLQQGTSVIVPDCISPLPAKRVNEETAGIRKSTALRCATMAET